jgi:putative hydrolase of the HAD superfamily
MCAWAQSTTIKPCLAFQISPSYYLRVTADERLLDIVRSTGRTTKPKPPPLPDPMAELVSRRLPRTARALLFDVYGTLFSSSSGDIALAAPDNRSAFQRAIATVLPAGRAARLAEPVMRDYRRLIDDDHRESRESGNPHPEVDIRSVWRRIASLHALPIRTEAMLDEVAAAYESIANPVWPMPGLSALLDTCSGRVSLGIVSNAQFYTPLLFPAFLGRSLQACGFNPNLIAMSYRHGIAKPDSRLFRAPLAYLSSRGIDSSRTVYIGNDILNDVYAARKVGCMTVLFAGDARSLRLREDDARVHAIRPDSVARSLGDLPMIVGLDTEA